MSTRAKGFLAQIAEIEKQDAADKARREWEAAAPERAQIARDLAAAKRDLRKRLLMDVNESADFQYTKYDGRLDTASPGVVTKAIQDAWATFIAEHPELSKEDRKAVTMFLSLFGTAPDLAKPEVFEQALDYIRTRLSALDPQEVAPAPESITEDIAESACPFPPNSRAAERWQREQYEKEFLQETLGNELLSNTLWEIVNQSGLALSTADQQKFLQWLSLPAQRRRYKFTREEIRLGFAEFFDNSSFLTEQELARVKEYRAIDSMTSDDVKRAVGYRNDYSPREHAGIRQGGQ